MRKEKIFYVSRKIVCPDVCIVKAKTKKEAIEKAKNDDFHHPDFELGKLGDWSPNAPTKTYGYRAHEKVE